MYPLLEIEIEDYRSFTRQRIAFEDITSVVGANESGKSNLLNAIYHLSASQQAVPFRLDELRMGTPGYPGGQVRLVYTLQLSDSLLGSHGRVFPGVVGKRFRLAKHGCPRTTPTWEAEIDAPRACIPDLIRINNKTKFRKYFEGSAYEKKLARERSDVGWFVRGNNVDLRKKPFNSLVENGVIELVGGKAKLRYLADILKPVVLSNVRIFRWSCQEQDFLPERVNIESFLKKPSGLPTVVSMFQIAGWKREEFGRKLQNQNDMIYTNLLAEVERKMNSLIRNTWSTHSSLKVELQHKGDYLTIHLNEPGSKTPPEYRSDGLKWYLTFLINFRAHSKNIKNYILLVDEPGLHLHPRGQKDTLEELETLWSKHKNQVIYTTHQTFLISKNKPQRVRIIERKLDKTGAQAKNPFFASQVSDISNPRESVLRDKLLREALGFEVSDISPINEQNILVEGVFDRELLHIVNRRWQVVNLNDTSVIACGGGPNIAKHAGLYAANGLKVVCLYDSDVSGKSFYKRNDCVPARAKRQISDYVQGSVHESMEDIVPNEVFSAACERWFKTWGLEGSVPQRPRMRDMKKHMDDEKRVEMKHSLEDILIEEVRTNVQEDVRGFEIARNILEDLQNRLT